MKFARVIGCLWLAALVAGCSPPAATLPPPPQALRLAVTPALRPLGEVLRGCARQDAAISLIVEEIPAGAFDLNNNDLAFRLGQPVEQAAYAAQIGWETVGVIVHAHNPTTQLSAEELKALFSGATSQWAGGGGNVQVWAYPEGDEIRQVFDAAVLGQARLTASARLAPDPQAMLTSVAADPSAVGYLPLGWLTRAATPASTGVKLIRLETKLAESLRQPVIALSAIEPEGDSRALLLCVQAGWTQP